MYLERKKICPLGAFFDVPHKAEPVTAHYIEKKFPEFAKEMDGGSDDRCLLYFWKRNKETKVYEFIDEEAEEEVAEMFGVNLYNEEEEKEKKKQKYLQETRALTEEEIKNFKEELLYASQQMKDFTKNNATKIFSEQVQQGHSDSESESESESKSTTP